MSGDAFANENTKFAIPTRDDGCQLFAIIAAHFGNCECTQALFNSLTHAVYKRITLFGRYSECVGKVSTRKSLTNRKLENKLIAFIKSGSSGTHKFS